MYSLHYVHFFSTIDSLMTLCSVLQWSKLKSVWHLELQYTD
jgi:hypothetical protein